MTKFVSVIFLILFFSVTLTGSYLEEEVKAAYIKSFTNFIDWPEVTRNQKYFVMTIVGNSRIAEYMEELARSVKIKNKPLKIKHIDENYRDISGSHIVYISQDKIKQTTKILNMIDSKSVLSIGSSEDFIDSGVLICFYRVQNNVRFKIDLDLIRKTNLVFSSQLLKLGR